MRHKFTPQECSLGSRNQSSEQKSRAGQMGFQSTMEKHPYMARKYLKHARGMRLASERFSPDENKKA